ncbi:SUMF1/EgtB/PvdO family nonheme iron enzyme [Leptolyngbya sp. FACHB-17]|nr:SUMF1/EgtB/PvdO family nonheme iron enzyme [Leptolyngbya sp. FACHB-17]
MLIRLIEEGHYPFDPEIEANLQEFRQELQLTDEEVETIADPIFEAAEEEYREKLKQQERQRQQEYQVKLQRYEQEFTRAVDSQYPIDSFVRSELRKFQQSLKLSDEDVARIEEPLITSKEQAYQQRLAEEQQRREEAKRQLELERQQDLEQQRLEEEHRKREEAKRNPPLQTFEYQAATLSVTDKLVEKPGLFRNKTETERTYAVSYRGGQAEYFVEDLGNGVMLEMVAIPGGTFMMGSPASELERSNEEGPQHTVTIQPFYMGKFAVTQAQWSAIAALPKVDRDLSADPSSFKGKGNNRPVERISWFEAVEFCERLNRFVEGRNSHKTGTSYRLPSEAQWEYACRAGTTTPFHVGKTITTDLANYDGNYTYGSGKEGEYRRETTDVGSFPPNAFGLYDMHGNVREWCADYGHNSYDRAPVDGTVWSEGGAEESRLLRGGSWSSNPRICRSAARFFIDPATRYFNFGFRVVCVLA